MKSKLLTKGTSAVGMVAIRIISTINPVPAHAGVPGVFATEYTQILNYVELAAQLQRQISMVQNQFAQIEQMAKHGIPLNGQIFGVIASDMTDLRQVVNSGQALAYTMDNIDQQFNERFPGYLPSSDFAASYKSWTQTSNASTLGALKAANLQNSQFNNDAALLQTLQKQSNSSVGILQAIQVGGEIAENQSEQLMKLRQLMMADMQSKGAYQSTMIQAESTKQANSDAFFGQTQITSDGVKF